MAEIRHSIMSTTVRCTDYDLDTAKEVIVQKNRRIYRIEDRSSLPVLHGHKESKDNEDGESGDT